MTHEKNELKISIQKSKNQQKKFINFTKCLCLLNGDGASKTLSRNNTLTTITTRQTVDEKNNIHKESMSYFLRTHKFY